MGKGSPASPGNRLFRRCGCGPESEVIMSDWPVGLSTGMFYEMSIFDCLERIVGGGFSLVEVCSSPAHLDYHDKGAVREAAGRIGDLGIEAYSFHAPFSGDIDITSPDAGRREHALREMILAAEAAATLEARYFVIHPGPEEGFEVSAEERLQRMRHAVNVLDRVTRRCGEMGVAVVLENMLPHLFCGHTAEMLWVLGALETVGVGTCLDTGHALLSGDVYRVMHKLSGHLAMMHANDGRGERDDHLSPGEGSVQWEKLLRELDHSGFSGGIILELAGDTNVPMETALARAREGRRFLRSIDKRLALSSPPTVAVSV